MLSIYQVLVILWILQTLDLHDMVEKYAINIPGTGYTMDTANSLFSHEGCFIAKYLGTYLLYYILYIIYCTML